ncbi:hypothetical protein CIY_29210 [Butyrivibrio fibrisolvens 16/4]|nr:hypothetical protein CIY_29210 [Butyrivibrio fibrisolvens 16/4]
MKAIEKVINERLEEVNKLLNISNKQLINYSSTQDIHIQTSVTNGREQFYCFDGTTHTRKYLKSGEIIKYAGIIQRDYDLLINYKLQKIQKKLSRISRDIKDADLEQITGIYEKMASAKKPYITPIIESDEEFIARWYERNQSGQNTYPIEGIIYTARGEHVRSKSEKILADLFEKYDIPYVYEPMLKLKNGHVVSPDFVLLNTRQRKTIYWEHLGLIDQEEYAVKNLLKLQSYEDSGIVLGENLFISMESTKQGMNTKIVEMYIKNMFL